MLVIRRGAAEAASVAAKLKVPAKTMAQLALLS